MVNNTLSFSTPSDLFDPMPYGFCHTVKVPSNGEIVHISGQSGGEGKDHTLSEHFRHQVKALWTNLEIALKFHELGFNNVMKITIIIVEHSFGNLSIWGEEMNEYWTNNTLPASTLIPVPALKGMQVEVDAIAFKPV